MSSFREEDRRNREERRIDVIRRERRRRFLQAAGIALVALLGLRSWVGRPPPTIDVTPPSLIGTWVTESERYADRAFVIGQDDLELHVGDGIVSNHAILSIQEVEAPDHWAYKINYTSPDGAAVLEVFLHADGVLRLKNPNDVAWTRK